jgi:serine/threonine-protein kinase
MLVETAAGMPERIGPYELLLPIGSGGMAAVYLARRHGEPDAPLVALKLTHPHLRTQPARAQELVAEARIATRIEHAHVVRVLDVGDDAQGVYLVMEYVDGDSLAGLLATLESRSGAMPTDIALGIMCQVLEGLHAAHELATESGEPLGLVHRDVSPQNILVGVDGVARLTDFGIAKSKESDVTMSGIVKGKFGYMAPEQLRGRELDRRADVWGAGVVAWELVTRQRLFDDADHVSNMLRLVTQKPRRVREVAPELPQPLDDAIAGALELEPAKRWQSAAELAGRLRASAPFADRARIGTFVRFVAKEQLAERAQAITTRGIAMPVAEKAPSSGRGMIIGAAVLAAAAAVAAIALLPRALASAPAVNAVTADPPAPPSARAIASADPPAPPSSAEAPTPVETAPSASGARAAASAHSRGVKPRPPTGKPKPTATSLLDNPYRND